MKIVIDIPKYVYDVAREENIIADADMQLTVKAIGMGTPLPKGHGRLIDADMLTRKAMVEHWYHLKNGDVACPKIDIDHAPTIIEADKGEQDDNN